MSMLKRAVIDKILIKNLLLLKNCKFSENKSLNKKKQQHKIHTTLYYCNKTKL